MYVEFILHDKETSLEKSNLKFVIKKTQIIVTNYEYINQEIIARKKLLRIGIDMIKIR